MMKKNQNYNHPPKGSKTRVDPTTDLKDIKTIKKMLQDNPRDLCVFVLGININLRAIDLCEIKVRDVKDLKVGDELVLTEKKTGKERRINLNKDCVDSIKKLLRSFKLEKTVLQFFRGRQGDIGTKGVNYFVKK